MGQKAKNAGKKKSKTCDRLATAKSVCCNTRLIRVKTKTTYTTTEGEEIDIYFDEDMKNARRKMNGRQLELGIKNSSNYRIQNEYTREIRNVDENEYDKLILNIIK